MYQEKNILCYKNLHKSLKTIINLLVNLTLILALSSRTPSSFCAYMHRRMQIWKLWAHILKWHTTTFPLSTCIGRRSKKIPSHKDSHQYHLWFFAHQSSLTSNLIKTKSTLQPKKKEMRVFASFKVGVSPFNSIEIRNPPSPWKSKLEPKTIIIPSEQIRWVNICSLPMVSLFPSPTLVVWCVIREWSLLLCVWKESKL